MNMKDLLIALAALVLLCLGGADCRRYPVGSGGRSSVPASRAVDPGRHRLLLQVTLTGKEENET